VSSAPPQPSREGNVAAAYDAAGNMTGLALHRFGPCLPQSAATCSQRFAYDWDEVGRLARARRWDTSDPGDPSGDVPTATPDADLKYAYDAADDRVIKWATDAGGAARHSLYPLDALEIHGTVWNGSQNEYERTARTEVAYLFAQGVRLGRIASAEEDLPSLTSGASHVFLELMDHLGSTGIVLDRDTGELVEAGTYQAYGATESDYRPERWRSFREDYRFTGKEEDVEVGIQYFGKRYYAPLLGRWMSVDPLALHTPGSADLNVYAYVHGAVLKAVDPSGLDDEPGIFQTAWNAVKARFNKRIDNTREDVKEANDKAEDYVNDQYRYWREHPGEFIEGFLDKEAQLEVVASLFHGGGSFFNNRPGPGLVPVAGPAGPSAGAKPASAPWVVPAFLASKKGGGQQQSSGASGGGKRGAGLKYEIKPQDRDWRESKATWLDALNEAFAQAEAQGASRDEFQPTKWARSNDGKTFVVEWEYNSDSLIVTISMDQAHEKYDREGNWVTGPDTPHVGSVTTVKAPGGGKMKETVHYLLNEVPAGRDDVVSE
jgi:RHS repeat-associated protein